MITQRINRRRFLSQAGTLTALGLTLPSFLQQSRPILEAAPIDGLPDDRVLILIQLAGGNDGLNTLVPYADDIYQKSRPRLAKKGKEIISSFEQLPLVHLPSPGVSGRSVVGRTAAAPFTNAKAEDEDWTHFFLVINFLTSPTALVLFI